MQGNMEPNQSNAEMSDARANAMRKLETLRMRRRAEVPRTETRQRSAKIPIPPTPPAREVNPSTLAFLFEKRLKYSDVKDEGRIVVPKSFAEKFMPALEAKEGLYIFMDDMTEVKVWRFRYRFWPNNTSRVYVLENAGEFVRARGLQIGDFMMIYKDNETERFAVGVRRSGAADGPTHLAIHNSGVTNVPPALTSNITMMSPAPLPYFEEMQGQGGSSSSTPSAADQSVPEVATSSSSYIDGFDDFPMDLLDMDIDISDLPDY